MSKIVNVFACGGCGVNIATKLEVYRGQVNPGFASFNCIYLDTSLSNLDKSIPDGQFMHIADDETNPAYNKRTDGAGKKRDSLAPIIAPRIKQILNTYKPTDFNIVLHSTSGGSGSVIAPSLVSEMLSKNISVLVIMVGSRDTRIEAYNTLKTLQSYEKIASSRNKPVIAAYYENNTEHTRAVTDSEVGHLLGLLSVFFSGENKELDTGDLANWLDYTRITAFPPRLSFLGLFNNEVSLRKGETIVSVATLVDANSTPTITLPVNYQAIGYVKPENVSKINITYPQHAVALSGTFNEITRHLNTTLEGYDSAIASMDNKTIITGDEDSDDNGLMF